MYPIEYQIHQSYDSRLEGAFLPVSIRAGTQTVVMEAAVDTGASFCLFARSVADSLGIDVESGLPQVFASASGRLEAFGHTVQLSVLGTHQGLHVFGVVDRFECRQP